VPSDRTLGIGERRRRARLELSCAVRVTTREQLVMGETKDISSDGLYCFVDRQFPEGEEVSASVVFPPLYEGNPPAITLDMQLVVLRCEPNISNGSFGIACRVKDYHVEHS
jgi:hypothetical protein